MTRIHGYKGKHGATTYFPLGSSLHGIREEQPDPRAIDRDGRADEGQSQLIITVTQVPTLTTQLNFITSTMEPT